jgi:adenine-specific DNA-methyltransferase
MTDAERAFWFAVRDRRLAGFKFRRQAMIGYYIADFVCAEARLVVEIDGGQHLDDADARRTADIKRAGFRVLRFWNNDVLANLSGVLTTVHAHLNTPSPACGRGLG